MQCAVNYLLSYYLKRLGLIILPFYKFILQIF